MKKTILVSSIFFSFQFLFAQQPTQQWLSKYNGKGDNSDKFNAISLDNTGNIILAGYTVNTGNKKDFSLVKLNSTGDTLWTKTFDGAGNSDDEILAMVTDVSGNIYVTGSSKGIDTDEDFLTQMYSTSGNLIWSTAYNFSANNEDIPSSIAIDASGNTYVTGLSDNDASATISDDYVTLKYNSTGIQQWVNRYNGIGNATDRAVKVLVGNSGNIYVTGRSDNGNDDDFVTIKYNNSGTQIWLRSFDSGDKDKGDVMAIDASENIYISGRSFNGSNDDYMTIKYNSSGTLLWSGSIYDGLGNKDDKPTAITVDGSGNTYVTGRADRELTTIVNYDFATIKYNSSGTQIWAQTYNGIGNGNDTPTALTIDNSGNVIVCGTSDIDPSSTVNNNNSIVISYSFNGAQNWNSTINGTSNLSDAANAIVTDNNGNVFIGGLINNSSSQKDGLALKYSSTGTKIWQKSYNGIGDKSDNVNAIAVDNLGNSYLAGYTYGFDSEKDLCIIKLNPSGDTLWTRKYNGTSNSSDEAMDLILDGSNNIYVTGYVKESVSGYNFFTAKYSNTGVLVWQSQYNNTTVNGSDKASNITLDNSGNVYVTGYSDSDVSSSVTNEDYVTIKYSNVGTQMWVTRYNGTGNSSDIPVGIKVDGSGNAYVTGKSFNGLNDAFATIKYNSSGTQLWASIYSAGHGTDRASAIEVDGNSNVYVTGRSNNSSDDDFATIKYNSSGVQQWITYYDGGNGDDRSVAVAVDNVGNSYVTGKSSNGITDDFATIKYNSSGVQQWIAKHDGIASRNDVPTTIKVNAYQEVFVAGESDNGSISAPNTDFTLLKYNAEGLKQWEETFDGIENRTDGINAIALSGNSIYVSGNSSILSEQKNIVTIKYDEPAGLNEVVKSIQNQLFYPNPFTSSTTIKIPNGENRFSTLFIYNVSGQEVLKLDINLKNELKLERENLPNGFYSYQLIENGEIFSAGKLIIQ